MQQALRLIRTCLAKVDPPLASLERAATPQARPPYPACRQSSDSMRRRTVAIAACLSAVWAVRCSDGRSGTLSDDVESMLPQCDAERSCTDGALCVAGSCTTACESAADLCGIDNPQCCSDDERCIADRCQSLNASCATSADCMAEGMHCSEVLGRCVATGEATNACIDDDVRGFGELSLACQWQAPPGAFPEHGAVLTAPAVGNLSDDNGDGRTDLRDTPDIVFVSARDPALTSPDRVEGVIRVVSGACNPSGQLSTLASLTVPTVPEADGADSIAAASGVLLVDLDPGQPEGQRVPEIVTVSRDGSVFAWKRRSADARQWDLWWEQRQVLALPASVFNTTVRGTKVVASQPTAHDVNGDGNPDVLLAHAVLDGRSGEVLRTADLVPEQGLAFPPGQIAIGQYGPWGPSAVVADLANDGAPELITGWTIQSAVNGEFLSRYNFIAPSAGCPQGTLCEGIATVGDFNGDGRGEIALTNRGSLALLAWTEAPQPQAQAIIEQAVASRPECNPTNATLRGGPAAVRDLDGDGSDEVLVLGVGRLTALGLNCGDGHGACVGEALWGVDLPCNDALSTVSTFDLDGDGDDEVLHLGTSGLRILSGQTGELRARDASFASFGIASSPVVADVNNDGSADVLGGGLGGLRVWTQQGGRWATARRVWSQPGEHRRQTDERNNLLPEAQQPWLAEPPAGFRAGASLSMRFGLRSFRLSWTKASCLVPGEGADLAAVLTYDGNWPAALAVEVRFSLVTAQGQVVVDGPTVALSREWLPHESVTVESSWLVPRGLPVEPYRLRASLVEDSGWQPCDSAATTIEAYAAPSCIIR